MTRLDQARARLHAVVVDLWRASLDRDLTASELRRYNAAQHALHPLLEPGFGEKYLGHGTYYATNAEWDKQLAKWKSRAKASRPQHGRTRRSAR